MGEATRRTGLMSAVRGSVLLLLGACSGAVSSIGEPSAIEVEKDASVELGDGGGGGAFPTNDADPIDSGVTDAGPVSCPPSLPATFAPVWIAPVQSTSCTSVELGMYFEACTPDVRAQTCKSWLAAHTTCGECIQRPDNSGPIQIYRNGLFSTLNVAGCVAIEQKAQGGTETCAKSYDAYAQCRRQSCDQCFDVPLATYSDFQACQLKAKSETCPSYDSAQAKACVGFTSADGGAPRCFPSASESAALSGDDAAKRSAALRTYFVRVEGISCGP
jgi:hypothetical protein